MFIVTTVFWVNFNNYFSKYFHSKVSRYYFYFWVHLVVGIVRISIIRTCSAIDCSLSIWKRSKFTLAALRADSLFAKTCIWYYQPCLFESNSSFLKIAFSRTKPSGRRRSASSGPLNSSVSTVGLKCVRMCAKCKIATQFFLSHKTAIFLQ